MLRFFVENLALPHMGTKPLSPGAHRIEVGDAAAVGQRLQQRHGEVVEVSGRHLRLVERCADLGEFFGEARLEREVLGLRVAEPEQGKEMFHCMKKF